MCIRDRLPTVGDRIAGIVTVISQLPQRLVDVAVSAFGPAERDPNGLIGVVGVGRLAGEISSLTDVPIASRAIGLIEVVASLNIALFVFNLIPLVPLDGGHIVVALAFGEENQWNLLCAMLGVPELIDDARFETGPKRTRNHADLEPILNVAFKKRTTHEWYADLLEAGIPCGPVNTVPDVVGDEQVRFRESIKEVTHPVAGTIPIADTPIRLSRSETGIHGCLLYTSPSPRDRT